MIVLKIFNNNIVYVKTENGDEKICMGKGIAFQKKVGDKIDPNLIEKTFQIEDKEAKEVKYDLYLENVPYEYIMCAKNLEEFFTKELGIEFGSGFVISLADHILVASKNSLNHEQTHPLAQEINHFYADELKLAFKALEKINLELGILLPETESYAIALHIINTEQKLGSIEKTVAMTKLINNLLTIVKYHFGYEFNKEDIHYARFITHLKFFSLRILGGENYHISEEFELYYQIQKKYPDLSECVDKIASYLKNTYELDISNDEKSYLILHLNRLQNKK